MSLGQFMPWTGGRGGVRTRPIGTCISEGNCDNIHIDLIFATGDGGSLLYKIVTVPVLRQVCSYMHSA